MAYFLFTERKSFSSPAQNICIKILPLLGILRMFVNFHLLTSWEPMNRICFNSLNLANMSRSSCTYDGGFFCWFVIKHECHKFFLLIHLEKETWYLCSYQSWYFSFGWVSDCCLTPIQLHVYHSENKLIFNEMMMSFDLY
jgi:hypothetical protein